MTNIEIEVSNLKLYSITIQIWMDIEGGGANKGRYGCAGRALGISGVNFAWALALEGKFCPGIRFLAIFDKKMCNI